ncbi:MAG: hypothetical protein JXA71_03675 [Chitinispirillaceae bacterium]|nr:hypothetical protein [Chitinispirillaceae bacterium]
MKQLPVVVIALCCLAASCYRSERVTLAIDFSQAHTWRYLFGVDISGSTRSGKSSRTFSSSLRTYLAGEQAPHDKHAVRFKTAQAMIQSDFLDDPERRHLERQCENVVLFFSPREGAMFAIDTALPPLFTFGGWDLFRSFSRVIPVLPESPVTVGSSWERERTVPIETSAGNALGNLYQSFILDSVYMRDSSRCAAISWQFTYRIQPDSSGILDSLPLRGSGNGTATVDLSHKRLVTAHAFFSVPEKSGQGVTTSWQEAVHVELIN